MPIRPATVVAYDAIHDVHYKRLLVLRRRSGPVLRCELDCRTTSGWEKFIACFEIGASSRPSAGERKWLTGYMPRSTAPRFSAVVERGQGGHDRTDRTRGPGKRRGCDKRPFWQV